SAYRRRLDALEENLHRRHHVRMGVEGAAREADVRRAILAEALHQAGTSADHADGEAATERLAVSHHVGAHAEIFLRAARGQPEADEHLVEYQHDAAFRADF